MLFRSFTLLAARCVGPTGRVDAFEPQPENLARLRRHVELNAPLPQVRIHDVALSEQAGEVNIYSFAGVGQNHGCSSIFQGQATVASKSIARTVRLDEQLSGAKPQVIKLDIEGAEPLAISGMSGMLQDPKKAPVLIIEYNPEQAVEAGFTPEEFLRRVVQIQPAYRIWKIGAWLTPLQLDTPALKELRQCNLLLRTMP